MGLCGWVDELLDGRCGWVDGLVVGWMDSRWGCVDELLMAGVDGLVVGWMAGGVVVGWQVLCHLLVVSREQKGKSHFCLLFSERKKSKKDREAST